MLRLEQVSDAVVDRARVSPLERFDLLALDGQLAAFRAQKSRLGTCCRIVLLPILDKDAISAPHAVLV